MKRILVANRGEIARRILRSARAAGYETVAVYSDADAEAPHVREATCAVRLGPAPPAESYLHIERLLDAARRSGADAVHPGYGFLSERAAFARAVVEAGLVFIGPSAEAIDAMGDKSAAKARMVAAGVPCIPGYHGAEQAEAKLLDEARAVGFPLMIKAAAGGGGRGMRLVHSADALLESLRAASSEAASAFGDGTLLLERALLAARHVEVQVFGDADGHIVHFGERDCSVQRRNQKVVEESPSPAVDAELRARMGEAAVRAARSVGYVGAGTVEFMLEDGAFYFLEMNTRLQVEHPVTELVYGVDLVDLQLRVAEGKPIPWSQPEIDARRSGHAIEVRLCAEDAAFRPQTGPVLRLDAPAGVRMDAGVETGGDVSPFYDSMIAKIVAHGSDREAARRKLVAALSELVLFGVETNRDVLRAIASSERFASGQFTTRFLEDFRAPPLPEEHVALAALAFERDDAARLDVPPGLVGWHSATLADTVLRLERGDDVRSVRIASPHVVDGRAYTDVRIVAPGELRYRRDGREGRACYLRDGDELWLSAEGAIARYVDRTHAPPAVDGAGATGAVRAPSDGRVVRVVVAKGDRVEKGQLLVVLESMKMEFQIVSPGAGEVAAVHVAAGDQVHAKRVLVDVA